MPTLYPGIALRKLMPMEGIAVTNSAADKMSIEFHRFFTLPLALLAVLAICGCWLQKGILTGACRGFSPDRWFRERSAREQRERINVEKPIVKLRLRPARLH